MAIRYYRAQTGNEETVNRKVLMFGERMFGRLVHIFPLWHHLVLQLSENNFTIKKDKQL